MLATRVRIGELDRLITIQEPVITNGTAGSDIIDTWTDLDDVYAKVTEKTGTEGVEAGRNTYLQSTIFTIRYYAGLNTRMRIIYSGFVYAIVSITENGGARSGFLDIVAELKDTESIT